MNCKTIREKVAEADSAICRQLDWDTANLNEEYLADLKNDFEEEADGNEDFDEYLDDNINEHIDFALGAYLEKLIPQVSDVTAEEIASLTVDEKDELFREYIDRFKEKSGLGYGDPEPWDGEDGDE